MILLFTSFHIIWFCMLLLLLHSFSSQRVRNIYKRLSSFILLLVILSSKCNFLFDDGFLCLCCLLLCFPLLFTNQLTLIFIFIIHSRSMKNQREATKREWERERSKLKEKTVTCIVWTVLFFVFEFDVCCSGPFGFKQFVFLLSVDRKKSVTFKAFVCFQLGLLKSN